MASGFNNRFQGLVPALDNRQRDRFGLLDGRNVMLRAEGIYSEFGVDFASYEPFQNPEQVQTFEVYGRVVVTSPNALLYQDEESQLYIPAITFADGGEIFPWSHVQVARKHYFAKKGQPLIIYDEVTDSWSAKNGGSDSVPVGVCSVTRSAGRLVVQGASVSAWSAIDDGEDLTPSTATGAGFQSTAIIGGGDPLGVKPTDDGFITYTTRGVMKSVAIDASNPFRHFALTNAKAIPINPYCIIDFEEDSHVILTKTGLHITDGGKPAPWQPLMSEWLRTKLLPFRDISLPSVIRLTYAAERQWLFISIADNANPRTYNFAYVLNIPLDEWGRFDAVHAAFGQLKLNQTAAQGYNFGYVCPNSGCLKAFSQNPRIERRPDYNTYFMWHKPTEIAPRVNSGVTIFTEVLYLDDRNPALYTAVAVSGPYKITPRLSLYSPDVMPYTAPSVVGEGVIVEDWNVLAGEEDWNVLSGEEDWNGEYLATLFSEYLGIQVGIRELYAELAQPNYSSINSYALIGLYRVGTGEASDEFSLATDVTIGAPTSPEIEAEDWNSSDFDVAEDWNLLSGEEDWGAGVLSGVNFTPIIYGSLDGISQFEDQRMELELVTQTEQSRYYSCYNNGIYQILMIDATAQDQSFVIKTVDITLQPAGRL